MKNLIKISLIASICLYSLNAAPISELDKALNDVEKINEMEHKANLRKIELNKAKKSASQAPKQKTQRELMKEKEAIARKEYYISNLKSYLKILEKSKNEIVAQAIISDFTAIKIGKTKYLLDEKTLTSSIKKVNDLVNLREDYKTQIYFLKEILKSKDSKILKASLNNIKNQYRTLKNRKITSNDPRSSIQGSKIALNDKIYVDSKVMLKYISPNKIAIYYTGDK